MGGPNRHPVVYVEGAMGTLGKGFILWLLGVPTGIVVLLWLFGVLG